MRKIKEIGLKKKDQKKLKELTKKGTIKARKLNRCRILLLGSEGKSQYEIAKILQISRATYYRIARIICSFINIQNLFHLPNKYRCYFPYAPLFF